MSPVRLVVYAPLAVLLVMGAASDVRARRIPNWVTLSIAALGIAQSFAPLHVVTPGVSIAGFCVGLGLTLVIYLMGGLAGGDVKLVAGVGAWVGAVAVVEVFAAAAIVGLFVVLLQAASQGKLKALFVNTAVLALTLVNVKRLGAGEVAKSGKAYRSIDKPIPYAVLVLVGTAAVVLCPMWLDRRGGQ